MSCVGSIVSLHRTLLVSLAAAFDCVCVFLVRVCLFFCCAVRVNPLANQITPMSRGIQTDVVVPFVLTALSCVRARFKNIDRATTG